MAAQREWYEKDYYKVLGVSDDATAKEITKAYRKLARDSHPDTHPGDAAAEERFKDVSAAYDVLGDEAKRKEYDEVRRLGPSAAFGARWAAVAAGGGQSFNVGADGLGDLLGQMFGRGRRGGGASAGGGPQRGADLEATLTLDFADAVTGITTTLYLTTDAQCSTCNGSGRQARHAARRSARAAAVAVSSTTTRASSRSRRRAALCGGRGVVDRGPVPHVLRLGRRDAPARGPGAHPRRRVPTGSRSA